MNDNKGLPAIFDNSEAFRLKLTEEKHVISLLDQEITHFEPVIRFCSKH